MCEYYMHGQDQAQNGGGVNLVCISKKVIDVQTVNVTQTLMLSFFQRLFERDFFKFCILIEKNLH